MVNLDINYGTKKKILVVDDEVDLTRLLKRILEKAGNFDVRIENDAMHAVAVAREFKPDVILLDVIMPGKNGTQIAAEIRKDKNLVDSKIVFFSALLGQNDTGATGKMVSGNMRLSKLVNARNVVNCVENCLVN